VFFARLLVFCPVLVCIFSLSAAVQWVVVVQDQQIWGELPPVVVLSW
jgi:hypothetical protein